MKAACRTRIFVAASLLGIGAIACNEPPVEPLIYGCTTEARDAIVLTLRDAATGRQILDSATITFTMRGDDWVSNGQASNIGLPGVWTVGRHAGIYDVIIARPGYVTWIQTGMVVEDENPASGCRKVKAAVVFAATLTPLPAALSPR